MADGYLEKRQRDYEARKAAFLQKKKRLPKSTPSIERPEDESL